MRTAPDLGFTRDRQNGVPKSAAADLGARGASCFETHRSTADSCKRLCSRCDAPQHEGAAHFGEAKPMAFWQTKPRENQPAAARNGRRLRTIVSGLLFTMNPRNLRAYGDSDRFWRNEHNAHFGETKPTILAKATSSSLRESHSKSAKRSSFTSFKRMSAPQIDACASAANWAHEPLWRRRPRAASRSETGHEAGLLHHAGASHAPQLGRDAQGGPRGHHP